MIKENKDFFLYVLGILLLFVVTMVLYQYIALGKYDEGNCGFMGVACWFEREEETMSFESPPDMFIDETVDYQAEVQTNYGDFTLDLFEKSAPKTVNNFIFLAKEGFYNNVKVHRIEKGVLIQTGDRNTLDSNKENDGAGGPGYTFEDEINWDSLGLSRAKENQLRNLGYNNDKDVSSRHLKQRSVAMANKGPDTNGSQFFVVTALNDGVEIKRLEGRHTVFAKVVSGWDVIKKIEVVEVDSPSSSSPRPLEEIVIERVDITKN